MIEQAVRMVWIDLEMTGLNPDADVILEIATIITDEHLNILAHGPHLVIHQSDEILEAMGPWCKEHHGASGLTEAVRASTISAKQAEAQTLNFIKKWCKPNEGFLSGNSVWQDRLFMRRYMPSIVNYLHYKTIDVSSVACLVSFWYPKDPNVEYEKKDAHRACDDIIESIEELRHVRRFFFKKS